jgi:ribokinase
LARGSVLVAGALHLDVIVRAPRLPRPDETLPGTDVTYAFGGKGGNQAVAAARHGAKVAMAGAVGSDAFAATLLGALDAAWVDRTQVATLPGASGMSVAILDAAGDYGAVIVSGANLAIDPAAVTLPEGTRICLLQNEVPEPVNIAAATAARAAGAYVILNAAPMRAMSPDFWALIDCLVVNRAEAEAITGTPIATRPDAYAQAERLAPTFDLLITLGPEGVLWRGGDGLVLSRAAPKVDPVSTHGAGDAFLGAFAARLALGDRTQAALDYAQGAAALHVATEPARRDRIRPADVRRLIG